MAARWLCSIQYLLIGVCFCSLPAAAATVADTRAPPVKGHAASAGMGVIDFLSLELVVLIGVVLFALVVIARSGKAP